MVASWSNWLRSPELKTLVLTDNPESAGRILAFALPFADVGEGAIGVGANEGGTFNTDGLHGTGLDESEVVEALGAVLDTACAEVRDLEDGLVTLSNGGSRSKSNGDGRDKSR